MNISDLTQLNIVLQGALSTKLVGGKLLLLFTLQIQGDLAIAKIIKFQLSSPLYRHKYTSYP
ncbi:hypothetical protein [Phormidesmis priestleyi]|uniref:hypothetical protein n=1 Tax=Phormidesmis priestleyi TaxID=268141 RepID=UPI000A471022|nr:hypothetical protein [Phormidesmis priestleyi]